MGLDQIQAIPSERLRITLERNKWTVERLATTTPGQLTKYKGIGAATAGKIIEEARALVNQAGLKESEHLQTQMVKPYQPPGAEETPGVEEPPRMSVRLQRLREKQKRGEL